MAISLALTAAAGSAATGDADARTKDGGAATADFQYNPVPALGQNAKDQAAFDPEGKGPRVLFVGNSITLHGPRPEIGWSNNWGMAASAADKDYVHLLQKKIVSVRPDAQCCLVQVAGTLERSFFKPEWSCEGNFRWAREFKPDVVVLFFGANVPKAYDEGTMDPAPARTFAEALDAFRDWVDPEGKATALFCQGFYVRPVLDAEKERVAAKRGDAFVKLEDFRGRADVHGRFNHPNDLGMQCIADRIWEHLEPLLAPAAPPAGQDIAKYDSNMAVEGVTVENGLKWIDGRRLPIEGRPFDDVDEYYDRLPSCVTPDVNQGVRDMKHFTAGMQFRFSTDSSRLVFRWVPRNPNLAMDHMPATGVSGIDVYRFDAGEGRWRYVKTGRITNPDGAMLDVPWTPGTPCLVNLPLYNGIREFSLGVERDAAVTPPPPRRSGVSKPVVFYGTSITHGGCASRPGMAFVNIVGRDLDVPVVNLGFSGSGVMELEMSDHLARIDAGCYVLDCLWNMGSAADGPRTGRIVEENYEPFIRNLRAKRPGVPIVMAGQCDVYCGAPNAKERYVRELHDRLVAEGWTNLFFLPGTGMFSPGMEGTVDGCHPNDLGMVSLAAAYGAAVSGALGLPSAR